MIVSPDTLTMGAGTGVKMGSVHPQANGDDVPLFLLCEKHKQPGVAPVQLCGIVH